MPKPFPSTAQMKEYIRLERTAAQQLANELTTPPNMTASQQYDANQQADTRAAWEQPQEAHQQGWAQPKGAVAFHYYRFSDEPTGCERSLCGAWGTDGVNADDLYDNNHGCSDHCKACNRARLA